ncbi:MAG TPA: response regulator transcription factor [Anaerolineae bacterium]|nr:response regulator transcription factor [Anaerolineae bacterium]HMR65382.1 response regulator transcription factor [Anaerolineae bacterium]
MRPKILIVDDEPTMRYFLRLHLLDHGYEVTEAETGQQAKDLIDSASFDLALVDLRLGDMDGLDVMRYLRQAAPKTSVIILTGHATLDSAIEALRQGAHDYVIKPYNSDELLASVADGIARRSADPAVEPDDQVQILAVKALQVNMASRQVTRAGTRITLTPTEFDILVTLMAQPDVAMDAITLVKRVRGYEATEADARAIARVHVHRLRHKLEADPANPEYIMTVAGGRYLINSQ